MATMIIFARSSCNRKSDNLGPTFFYYSFDYGFASSTRKMLEVWITKCSPNLAKAIIELFRMLFRSGLNDFYYWCLPFLNRLIGFGNLEEIATAAFDVLEEVCFDQNSLNQLLLINDKILDSLRQGGH